MTTHLAASDNIRLPSHTFWRSGVWPCMALVGSPFRVNRLTSGIAPMHFFLETLWENLLPNPLKFLAEYTSLWMYTWVPVSLPVLSWGSLPGPGGHPDSFTQSSLCCQTQWWSFSASCLMPTASHDGISRSRRSHSLVRDHLTMSVLLRVISLF